MADTFRASKYNQMVRSCPECGDNVIPIMSPETTCTDCKIDKQYEDLNIKTNEPNVDDDYLVNTTIAEGGKTKKLRKKQY
ncbi:uncharacterized protein METZ01_LOCUS108797 [marine metagenome]|uniref:Uncharacterized protein n=1 Tax=marine metagenome TaxID=408172 RepID=A0A381WVH4_9ZZZZ